MRRHSLASTSTVDKGFRPKPNKQYFNGANIKETELKGYTENFISWVNAPNLSLLEQKGRIEAHRRIQAYCRDLNLKKLDLANLNLTSLPEFTLPSSKLLTELDLSNNNLKFIPKTFLEDLKSLEVLKLSHNQLVKLPQCINSLYNLIDLQINFNKLCEVSANIFKLPKLIYLNLSQNQITLIGDITEIGGSLKALDLSKNRLTKVPAIFIEKLVNKQLHFINLSNNLISNLPFVQNNGIEIKKELNARIILGNNKIDSRIRSQIEDMLSLNAENIYIIWSPYPSCDGNQLQFIINNMIIYNRVTSYI